MSELGISGANEALVLIGFAALNAAGEFRAYEPGELGSFSEDKQAELAAGGFVSPSAAAAPAPAKAPPKAPTKPDPAE